MKKIVLFTIILLAIFSNNLNAFNTKKNINVFEIKNNYNHTDDTIYFKNGYKVIAKVEEISDKEIKYRLNSEGPLIVVKKKQIARIKLNDGTSADLIGVRFNSMYTGSRINTYSLIAFIASLAGLIIMGIPFGLTGIIYGVIGLVQISKSPFSQKGKGFAYAGMFIGFIDVILVLIILGVI